MADRKILIERVQNHSVRNILRVRFVYICIYSKNIFIFTIFRGNFRFAASPKSTNPNKNQQALGNCIKKQFTYSSQSLASVWLFAYRFA